MNLIGIVLGVTMLAILIVACSVCLRTYGMHYVLLQAGSQFNVT